MNRFVRWAENEFGFFVRLLATLLAGSIFAFAIPYSLIVLAPKLDDVLAIPSFSLGLAGLVVSTLVLLLGLVFGFWSILSQLFRAQGTPLPIIPTQKLLMSGPFRYTRNPMSLGTILSYLALAIIIGSWTSVGLVVVLSVLLITYLKGIEEKELEARFGQEYRAYKRNVPFLFPRFDK
jgi:protein-S-isoprenylcysteine O-methyltransferase Ste14